ncbi:MAG: nicotinate-nucleotide--dimethylbenzimidazole phosphoribosyltransferase, partial [Acidimicrobiaceae bacterium]|nr:nicotinate-nucleotide--dimethylbenzimidazole phosphoribosyltransferase [Acidimicrobiaceae bacterium]
MTVAGGVLAGLLAGLPGPDRDARDQVAARAATVLRPADAFARLDAVAAWLAGWQGTSAPRVERPHVAVFAADHGVAADGVSAYPAEVTAAMVDAIRGGVATITVLAREVGATLELFDVGVGRPTGNIRVTDAMSAEEFDEAAAAGAAAVDSVDAD